MYTTGSSELLWYLVARNHESLALPEEESSVDLGMQVLLQSPILKMGVGLLLIDVGAFDGRAYLHHNGRRLL